jgi:hypothetical protein
LVFKEAEMTLRVPYVPASLSEPRDRLHELGVHEAVGLYHGELLTESPGEPKGHPLWIRQHFACIEYVLKIDVDNLTLLTDQDVIGVSVSESHQVAHKAPLCVGADEVGEPGPPGFDDLTAWGEEEGIQCKVDAEAKAVVEFPEDFTALVFTGLNEGFEFVEFLGLHLGGHEVIEGGTVFDELDQETVFAEVDDGVCHAVIEQFGVFEEVCSCAFGAEAAFVVGCDFPDELDVQGGFVFDCPELDGDGLGFALP